MFNKYLDKFLALYKKAYKNKKKQAIIFAK